MMFYSVFNSIPVIPRQPGTGSEVSCSMTLPQQILQALTEISQQIQTLNDLEHTSKSLNVCIYFKIQWAAEELYKNDLMMDGLKDN